MLSAATALPVSDGLKPPMHCAFAVKTPAPCTQQQ